MGAAVNDVAQALQGFFGGFGLPACAAGNVPDGIAPPYITWQMACPAPFGRARMRAWLWFRGGDYGDALAVVDAIALALGEGGASLPLSDGALHILPEEDFARDAADGPRNGRGIEMRMTLVRG